MINKETLKRLISIYEDSDLEGLEIINSAMQSFIDYYLSIYHAEMYGRIFSYKSVDREVHQETIMQLDRSRRNQHDCMLSNLNILNRMAGQNNLEPFYDGVVSTERPYRRIAADEVLSFVDEIIKQRA